VAIGFGEHGATSIGRRLRRFDELVSSNLLEAELRSTFAREKLPLPAELMSAISWVIPDRPLHAEIAQVLTAGQMRGADCWHIAAALYLSPEPAAITFLTLDERQRGVAETLGFEV
jgi:hypothetical protein